MPEVTVKVPVVVGEGQCQTLAEVEHVRSHPALELERITKKVVLKHAKVGHQEVVIKGVVCKNVEYETDAHLIGSDKFEVPFSCCIEVPCAMPGDDVQLLDAFVEVEEDQPKCGWAFKRLKAKLCILIKIKVTRLSQVQLDASSVKPEPVIKPVTKNFFDC